jgi:cytochrome c-type biogenesis protein CcmE
MPKDVADALKKQGLWKEEYGAASKGGNAARAAQSGQGAVR